MQKTVYGSSNTYYREQMCGHKEESVATTIGWREPGLIHVAFLEDLEPGTTYSYIYGDEKLNLWGTSHSFTVPPASIDADSVRYFSWS